MASDIRLCIIMRIPKINYYRVKSVNGGTPLLNNFRGHRMPKHFVRKILLALFKGKCFTTGC